MARPGQGPYPRQRHDRASTPASFLLQWAVGGLFFTWVTTRRREVGIGYGWMMRITYGLMALASILVARWLDPVPVRDAAAVGVVLATGVRPVRVGAAQGGGRRRPARGGRAAVRPGGGHDRHRPRRAALRQGDRRSSRPRLDLIAPAIGLVGLVAAGIDAGSPAWLSVLRLLVGAAFLGSITDAMLLGHWYLVQPGLARGPLLELVRWTQWIWPFEVGVMLIPVGHGRRCSTAPSTTSTAASSAGCG